MESIKEMSSILIKNHYQKRYKAIIEKNSASVSVTLAEKF